MNLTKIVILVTIFTTLGSVAVYMQMPSKAKPMTGKELYKAYFNLGNDGMFSRGYEGLIQDDSSIKEMRAQGMAAYGSKNYSGAIKFFEDYSTKVTKIYKFHSALVFLI